MSYRKKLIEVALPLDAINKASTRENYIYKGNPSAIHKWWSCKPLATSRAVLFASLVDDPSEYPERFPTEQAQERERDRLFKLIEDLVIWENSNDEKILAKARMTILESARGNLPRVLDLFCGGGSIPLEAQRLGLETYGSDLNPVAVLISKAVVEFPQRFANLPPVHPSIQQSLIKHEWQGSQGLADDIRYYGKWMRDKAELCIGQLYPKVKLPKEYGDHEASVLAWLWVRTVTCPNPACSIQMPLTGNWWLSKKKGKEAWVELEVDYSISPPLTKFSVKTGKGQPPSGTMNRQGAICVACGASVALEYIRAEGKAGHMNTQLTAIVAESQHGRVYISPNEEHSAIVELMKPSWIPDTELAYNPRYLTTPNYGLRTFADLFTTRQLVTLTTLSNLVEDVRNQVLLDAALAGLSIDGVLLNDSGTNATAYADAIAVYVAFACDKYAMYGCSLAPWYPQEDRPTTLFGRQAISMAWNFAEINPFTDIGGSIAQSISIVADSIASLSNTTPGYISQRDATDANFHNLFLISTDPPYYDYIGYADLSDFFYVWLRHSLSEFFPDLFNTVLVPKSQELVAAPYRFDGDKNKAQHFFEVNLGKAFSQMRNIQHPDYPLTVYYAFKQSESEISNNESNGEANNALVTVASTGWETMLEGLIKAGFTITGTWPMRTERSNRTRGISSNALASSIVLVCRPRPVDAPVATRREFLGALRKELPEALRKLQHGSIAPVDLAQASIGPGMSIYSRYNQVVESNGTPLRVRAALQMINQELDAALAEQEGEYDRETRWVIAWFEQYGMQEGEYGMAETLSKAKNMSVAHLEHSGLVESRAGKVRLRRREELSEAWIAPNSTVWEVAQRMIYALLEGKGEMGGEIGTANILRQALSLSESVRDLLYRLYTVCERKGWAQEAIAYNGLVTSWTRITDLAHRKPTEIQQATLL